MKVSAAFLWISGWLRLQDGLVEGFCPTAGINGCRRQPSNRIRLYSAQGGEASSSPADNLLKMVEAISDDQFSPEVLLKMEDLEKALVEFLEEQTPEKNGRRWSPRPPGTPPPIHMLESTDNAEEVSLIKAEAALEKLRDRLRREELALKKAEEALQKSLNEEEILRRAEDALQKSRAAAEKRKLEAIRQTEAAVASTEQARRDSEKALQDWDENLHAVAVADNERGIGAPRSTIPLDFLVDLKSVPKEVPRGSDMAKAVGDTAKADLGIPILSNWSQDTKGSIQGEVRNSDQFLDGSSISTSAVQHRVTGGSVVETSSGSK